MARARICPKCGGRMFVVGTAKYNPPNAFSEKNQYRRRRLNCVDCGYKMNTYEFDEEDFKSWYQESKTSKALLERVDRTLKHTLNDIRYLRNKYNDNQSQSSEV